MNAKVAVIVPVYNSEEYLELCVKSISSQTMEDIEIILVDDGSEDSSPDMCDRLCEKDHRFKVIHQINGGLAYARRVGAEASDAEYITYVDSDDWIEKDYVESLYREAVDKDADVVASNIKFDMGEKTTLIRSIFGAGCFEVKDILDKLIYSGCFFGYGVQPHMCSKLFKRKKVLPIMQSINSDICAGEDALVTYLCLADSKCISFTDICGYHYIWRPGSITNSETNTDDVQKLRNLFNSLLKGVRNYGLYDELMPQLIQYEKFHLLMRHLPLLDESGDKMLTAYGGLEKTSRIIIYGAGVLGQKIYNYLASIPTVNILCWADRNASFFRQLGYDVISPEEIDYEDDFDAVVIANTYEKTAIEIRKYLLGKGISDEKIRWLDEHWISNEYRCGILMS